MKITFIGHSLIHPRQSRFIEYLNSLKDVEIQEIYPSEWGNQIREGGYPSYNSDGIQGFTINQMAYRDIKEFKPDLLYSMSEFWQHLSYRSCRWSRTLNIPLVLFFWENLRQPSEQEQRLISEASLIICGNKECENIVKPYAKKMIVLPQIGLNPELFKPQKVEKTFEILFVGRLITEKGIEHVKKLSEEFDVTIVAGTWYEVMPEYYNIAKVAICPSLDTSTWTEQFPSMVTESLLCQVPVVAFDSGSIRSNYGNCEAVVLAKQGDYDDLRDKVKDLLDNPERCAELGERGRLWAIKNMSFEVVGEKLINAFKDILKKKEV